MSDDPNNKSGRDRDRVSHDETHERRYFFDSLKAEFPGVTNEELENAYEAARRAVAPSEDRQKLAVKIRELLD